NGHELQRDEVPAAVTRRTRTPPRRAVPAEHVDRAGAAAGRPDAARVDPFDREPAFDQVAAALCLGAFPRARAWPRSRQRARRRPAAAAPLAWVRQRVSLGR